ncbi:MAG: hypothetical protein ACOCZ5_00465 [bacterium]
MEEAMIKVANQLNQMMDVISLALGMVAIGWCMLVVIWHAYKYIGGQKDALVQTWVRVIIGLGTIILCKTLINIIAYIFKAVPTFNL